MASPRTTLKHRQVNRSVPTKAVLLCVADATDGHPRELAAVDDYGTLPVKLVGLDTVRIDTAELNIHLDATAELNPDSVIVYGKTEAGAADAIKTNGSGAAQVVEASSADIKAAVETGGDLVTAVEAVTTALADVAQTSDLAALAQDATVAKDASLTALGLKLDEVLAALTAEVLLGTEVSASGACVGAAANVRAIHTNFSDDGTITLHDDADGSTAAKITKTIGTGARRTIVAGSFATGVYIKYAAGDLPVGQANVEYTAP